MTPANVSLPLNYSQQYTATGVYSDSTTQDLTAQVTWSVKSTSLATISSGGLLATGTTPGAGSVSATLGAVTGTTPVTVTSGLLTSIGITPATVTVPVGGTQSFLATGIYVDTGGNSSSYDVTTQPGGAWHSSAASVASIDGTGLATALATGQTTITFTLQSVTSSPGATLTVPSGVTLSLVYIDNADPVTIFTSGSLNTAQLKAAGQYSDGSVVEPFLGVSWSIDSASLNPGAITVDPNTGLVTAVSVGTALVDLSYNGVQQDQIEVDVSAVTLGQITVSTTTPTVPLSLTAQYTATGKFTDGSSQDITANVTWTVQDTTIAGVSNTAPTNGLVTPLAAGSTTVVATLDGVMGSASLTVTPVTLVSIALTPSGATTLPLSFQEQFTASGTFSDGSVFDVTRQATWTSDNTAVAVVSNAFGTHGVVSALGTGMANIRAHLGTITSPATVLTVDVASLVSITISPTTVNMSSNSFQQFLASGTFSDGTTGLDITKQVFWHATKQKHIVSISNAYATKGLAHASRNTKKTGKVTVTASLNGITSNNATVNKTAALGTITSVDAIANPRAADVSTGADAANGSNGSSGGAVSPLVLLSGVLMVGVGAVTGRRRRRRKGRAA